MSAVVKADNLSKTYGNTKAMDQLSFTIEKGSIVGFIGPNGAGKTTTLKAILGLTSFEGELDVLGRDPRHKRHILMEEVCFIADVGILPRWMKVSEVIDFIEGVHPKFDRQKALALLAETTVKPEHKISDLSKGMVTQLHLSLILAIDVKLLILDEPTLGLDILYQKTFFDRLLTDYFDHDTSIIISTHHVEEVSPVLTHLMFIDEGKLILNESMDDVQQLYSEVAVATASVDQALSLDPLYVRESLGRKVMIFENADREKLAGFGDCHAPGIADLFMAKILNAREVA